MQTASLQKIIESLAARFATDLLTALRSAPVLELAETTSRSARLSGASREDPIRIKRRDGSVVYVGRDVLALTGLLSNQPGLRAEQIRAKLRWDRKTTSKAITTALDGKRISKKGQKRATMYYVG